MFSNTADCGNDLSNNADCGNHLMGAWHNTPWMWLSMLVFLALLIAFVYFAFRGASSSRFSACAAATTSTSSSPASSRR